MRQRNIAAVLAAGWVAASLALAGGVAGQQSAPASGRAVRLVVTPEGNEARYRVREQLAGFDLPNDAVGKTAAVTGALVFDESGSIVSSESEFAIDLTTLVSDQSRRDNYLRRNTLGTAEHPRAVFVPTAAQGLMLPLPSSGDASFQLLGNRTLRGVTRPVTWNVKARFDNGVVSGAAQTKFTFAEFELAKPRLARVLSVDDDIRLEYDFRMVVQPKS
jgi:polyisoprenoid-binding protein YceI